jgi:tetratricopeptide (TPR) repeat protein
MATGAASPKKRAKKIDYYKWIAGIGVPILVAVIGLMATLRKGEDKTPGNFTYIGSASVIENEYKQITGQPLKDPAVIAQLTAAANLAKAGQYDASRKILEQVSAAVPVPAVFTTIGSFYAEQGNGTAAKQYLQKAVALDGSYKPALETLNALKAPAPEPKAISGREAEPNNDIQHANILPVNRTIAAEITEGDTDYFQFTTGHPPRDIYRISIKNLSTTLAPAITVYDQQKGQLFYDNSHATPGSDLDHDFSPAADQNYYVQIWSNGNTQGAYSLTVSPQHRYDAFEPNDDIRSAKAIPLGKTIEANIMDSGDTDYYEVTSGSGKKLTASLKNTSTTLAPGITAYDSQKNQITYGSRDTAGADMDLTWDAQPNTVYYVQVWHGGSSSGSYTLTVH